MAEGQNACTRPVTPAFAAGAGSGSGPAPDAGDSVHEWGLMDTMSSSGSDGRGVGRDDPGRRRRYTLEEKQRLVAESFEPGTSVSRVARRHEINAKLLFTWRRQMRPPSTGEPPMDLIPVDIVGAAQAPPARAAVEGEQRGAIEIALVSGERVRVDGSVSEAGLKRVLSALKAAT